MSSSIASCTTAGFAGPSWTTSRGAATRLWPRCRPRCTTLDSSSQRTRAIRGFTFLLCLTPASGVDGPRGLSRPSAENAAMPSEAGGDMFFLRTAPSLPGGPSWPSHGSAMARPWPGQGPAMARPWPGHGLASTCFGGLCGGYVHQGLFVPPGPSPPHGPGRPVCKTVDPVDPSGKIGHVCRSLPSVEHPVCNTWRARLGFLSG
jgi:hypothetical protein